MTEQHDFSSAANTLAPPAAHPHDHPAHSDGHALAHDAGDVAVPSAASQIVAAVWLVAAGLVELLVINGRATNYVRTFWLPVLAVTAILVMAVAVAVLWRGRRSFTGGQKVQKVSWLVLIPTMLVVAAAPSPLGASMLGNSTSGSSDNVVVRKALAEKRSGKINFPPLNPAGPNELTVEELSDRFNFDDEKKLEGAPITMIGFVSHTEVTSVDADDSAGKKAIAGQGARAGAPAFMLNRFKIYCCAADAIAYSAAIQATQDFPDDSWVKVTGTLVPGASTPTLQAVSVTPVTQPKVPYL